MSERLLVDHGIGPWIDGITTRQPDNPFVTQAYCQARERDGDRVVGFRLGAPGSEVIAVGFVRSGRASKTCQIPTVPDVDATSPFWPALRRWCQATGVTKLVLDSFASRRAEIPPLGQELFRHPRWEFHLDLAAEDFGGGISSSHRRQVKQATKVGMSLRVLWTAQGVAKHVELMQAAQARRSGGTLGGPAPDQAPFRNLVEAGAGQFFQAVRSADNEVLASVLVLRSERSGYHHSSGTHADGAACGASHFVFFETARHLREQGATTFNFGGVREDEEGLRTFKERFGPTTIPLVKVGFDFTPPWKRALRRAANLVARRSGPGVK